MLNVPKATLIGWTGDLVTGSPLRTIAAVWLQSKSTDSLEQILNDAQTMSDEKLSTLLESVLEGVPVVECVNFVFVLENVSISWREQAVRHRVGTKPDIRVGADWMAVDTIPDVADLSMWSQSMRLLDMSTFATRGAYRTPDGVLALDEKQRQSAGIGAGRADEWREDMERIQEMYAKWVGYGLEREDARDLIPLGATSRLSWTLNLRTLQHIVGKRGCTILQLGLWGPVITSMIEELATKIHPVFRRLVTPPCMKGNQFVGCIFPEDNRRRLTGEDPNMGCCPLWIGRASDADENAHQALIQYQGGAIRNKHLIDREAEGRAKFWGRDAWTGQSKEVK